MEQQQNKKWHEVPICIAVVLEVTTYIHHNVLMTQGSIEKNQQMLAKVKCLTME